jgi:hypothetical protein
MYVIKRDKEWIFCQDLHLFMNFSSEMLHYTEQNNTNWKIWKCSDIRVFGFGIIHYLDFPRYLMSEVKIKTLRFWDRIFLGLQANECCNDLLKCDPLGKLFKTSGL